MWLGLMIDPNALVKVGLAMPAKLGLVALPKVGRRRVETP